MWSEKDWKIKETAFIKAYQAAELAGIVEPYCEGLSEMQARYDNTAFPEPVKLSPTTGKLLAAPEKNVAQIIMDKKPKQITNQKKGDE